MMTIKNKLFMIFLNFLPHKVAHKILFRKTFGRKLDLTNPISLNEKIHWLIINEYGKKEAELTDKYLAKELVKKMNIKDLLFAKNLYIIDKFKNISELNIKNLPDKFVIKCNHGSGNVFICSNKNEKDFENKIQILRENLNKNFAHVKLEYHYSYIRPVILIEEYLEDRDNIVPIDYKFFSYDGNTKCVMVCTDRQQGYKATFYDKEWNKLNFSTHPSEKEILKPQNFDKMWYISEKLSKGHRFVRVDLYNIDGKIYFSELTFTPAAGLSKTYTEEADKILGSYLNI